MECVGFVLALIFFSLLFLNVPVAVAIGSATMLGVAVAGGTFRPEIIVPERMMFGINSFPLLAIPFFVLSGILMGRGGMARRLIDFASALVGHLPGGLHMPIRSPACFSGRSPAPRAPRSPASAASWSRKWSRKAMTGISRRH